ncbi:hypothetical protein ACLI4U_09665 [Natrialbaceae archaeon A-CW2]
MNVFVRELSNKDFPPLEHHQTKLVVEDNVGESIHIHIRDFRLEMTIDDFIMFAKELEGAKEELNNGDC